MEIIYKYKNKIVIGIFVLFLVFLAIFFSFKFWGNYSNKEVSFDFSKTYKNIQFMKNEMYIFENDKFLHFNKSGKLKTQKEVVNNGKVKIYNDIIYSLMTNEMIMYSKDFDEIKKIRLDKEYKDFFIENNKIILVSNESFKIFDEALNELYYNGDIQNPGYIKFSKNEKNVIYTEYVKSENLMKSRFHILKLKDKSNICDFTFFNEFIIDFGFVNDSEDKLYVVTNEKLYIFEKNVIKNQYYIENLKDIIYDSGKIFLISDNIKVFNTKDLKLEKEVEVKGEYLKAHNLNNSILLVKKDGYSLINKNNFNTKEFSSDILDSIASENSVYLILKDRYKIIK